MDVYNFRKLIGIVSLVFMTCYAAADGQKGYRIQIHIEGIPDSVCYLANYYGDKTYLTDTARVGETGWFLFEGDSLLPGGIYIVAGQNNNKYFELMVDANQQFSVKTSMSGIPTDMQFEGSSENTLFYKYVNENIRIRKQIESLRNQQSSGGKTDELQSRIDSLFQVMKQQEEQLILDHPDSFVSVVLKARQEPDPVPPRYLADGSEDSVFAYQSYKNHFWDNLNPADERLLRTPLYHKRLQDYFEKIVYQQPDTLIREADLFVERASPNPETYKYAIWYLTYKFETSKIMGFDEIFVHMVDHYYAKGKAYWADASVVRSLKTRADELRQVLIGNPAPNLILLDTAGGFKSLYSIDANYLMVLFYEMGCSHCRKEIKELKTWVPDNRYGLQVMAVCTDTSLVEWKEFAAKQQVGWIHVNATRSVTPDYHGLYDIRVTPTIYLLDEKKRIIAKRLKAEQIRPFLNNYTNREKSIKETAPK